MATVVSDTSSAACPTVWLVNAAFLQEIKDSNPNLWHQFHDLRTICQLEPEDCESPQSTIKAFARCLNELRDQLALQFSLEESYGLISSPSSGASLTPKSHSPEETALQSSILERQTMVEMVISQHRSLYLRIVDHVEQAEELQYRGCEVDCLRSFAERVERYCQDFTAHERLESELIRLHGASSAMPPNPISDSETISKDPYGNRNHVR